VPPVHISITSSQCEQSNIKIAGSSSLIGKWITSIRYCYTSQAVHNEAYAMVRREEDGAIRFGPLNLLIRVEESHTLYQLGTTTKFVYRPKNWLRS
jgi:hypothetical protein